MLWNKTKDNVETVGVIGCGRMGSCMLNAITTKGYKVFAYDIFDSALTRAVEKGAERTDSPRCLAEKSDLIILSLPGPVELEEVLFGKNGVSEGLSKGKVVIDTSTVDPDTTRKNADRIENVSDVAYLDCPILGRPSATGRWMLPTGGDEEALKWVEPVLKTFASSAIPVGGHGAGNALKLLNQMMFTCINAISCETMAIAEKVGLDPKVYSSTVGASSAATNNGLFREVTSNIADEDYDHPAFTVDLLIKDTKLALQMAKDADAPSLIAGTVQMYNEMAHATGLGGEDTSALYKVFRNNYVKEINL